MISCQKDWSKLVWIILVNDGCPAFVRILPCSFSFSTIVIPPKINFPRFADLSNIH